MWAEQEFNAFFMLSLSLSLFFIVKELKFDAKNDVNISLVFRLKNLPFTYSFYFSLIIYELLYSSNQPSHNHPLTQSPPLMPSSPIYKIIFWNIHFLCCTIPGKLWMRKLREGCEKLVYFDYLLTFWRLREIEG